jgi:hypothetical protein
MIPPRRIKAPDITYGALIKAGFTDATIRDAIRKGLDEAGKPLKDAMPRWQMNDADLSATIAIPGFSFKDYAPPAPRKPALALS